MAFNHVTKIDNLVPVRNVLVSLFDKAGIEAFAKGLLETCPGIRFYSTGGTYKALAAALGDAAKDRLLQVSDYTGQPEMQGGLVKTLDFKIYLGLLGEHYNDAHQADLKRTGASEIDMVVGNLYPFQRVAAQPGVSPEDCRSNIDIGGPCMIRASAKNYIRVASVTLPGAPRGAARHRRQALPRDALPPDEEGVRAHRRLRCGDRRPLRRDRVRRRRLRQGLGPLRSPPGATSARSRRRGRACGSSACPGRRTGPARRPDRGGACRAPWRRSARARRRSRRPCAAWAPT